MRRNRVAALSIAMAIWPPILAGQTSANIGDLARAFMDPPPEARIMVRWWWFGPRVTDRELEREMRQMKAGGIGGFEVQPVYPLEVDGNDAYLSPAFLDHLRFVAEKAKALGLRFDLTLGSGWPYGGPHISVDLAAQRLRVSQEMNPNSREKLAFETGPDYFFQGPTGQQVKRAAVGAEGYVLDHYNHAALEAHLQNAGEKMLGAVGENRPFAIFSDSLEVNGADWTGDFLQEFQKRRGYDLKPYGAALVRDIGQRTASVRRDWGRTLTELANERYLAPLADWAHRHGTRLRSQTYGVPPVNLSSNSLVDLPEGEGFTWRRFSATRWASSASHLYGRPVTSSETWTWLHSPVFRATPLDMKAEADLHFLQGINQLVGHGWPYSPPDAGEPGQRFYAAAVLSDHNPWWLVMPEIAAYLERVSFMLRQGSPANDVALYLPTDDAYAGFTLGHVSVSGAMDKLIGPVVIPQILDAGYNFDFIDDEAIAKVGVPYRVLILPGVEQIPAETVRRIEEYTRKGGTVIATRRAPGESEALFRGPNARVIQKEDELGRALRAVLPPDVAKPSEVGFLHRKLPFADIYFLANTSNHPIHDQAVFRVTNSAPAWWDPFEGTIAKAGSGPRITLDLAPYESRVVVFSKLRAPALRRPDTAASPAIDLRSNWKVTFTGDGTIELMKTLHSWTDDERFRFYSGTASYERSVTIASAALKSRDSAFLDFGEGTIPAPPSSQPANGMRAMLESPVREAAVVYINGRRAGTVWRPPYEVEITKFLKPGENSIRIIVGNLAINRLAGEPQPDYRALIARYGDRFQPQDMDKVKPEPAGILGDVRIVFR